MLESLGLTGNVCPACVDGGDGAQVPLPLPSPGIPESLRELAQRKNGPVAQEATAKEDATDPQESSEEDDSDTDADATAEAKAEASTAEGASRKSEYPATAMAAQVAESTSRTTEYPDGPTVAAAPIAESRSRTTEYPDGPIVAAAPAAEGASRTTEYPDRAAPAPEEAAPETAMAATVAESGASRTTEYADESMVAAPAPETAIMPAVQICSFCNLPREDIKVKGAKLKCKFCNVVDTVSL